MSLDHNQPRAYIAGQLLQDILTQCRQAFVEAGGSELVQQARDTKALRRQAKWTVALKRLARLLPTSSADRLYICNTSAFCAGVLGVEASAEAVLSTAIIDVRTIVRRGEIPIQLTQGGSNIRGLIRVRQVASNAGAVVHRHPQYFISKHVEIKKKHLLTLNSLCSYIDDMPYYTIVKLPCISPGTPWIYEYIHKYVNVPDYERIHCAYISRIRLLIVLIDQGRRRALYPNCYDPQIFRTIDDSIKHGLEEEHSLLLQMRIPSTGELCLRHRHALVFYLFSFELHHEWDPARGQECLTKMQDILQLYRHPVKDEYLPFIIMTVYWVWFGYMLLNRFNHFSWPIDWDQAFTLVDFPNLPFDESYRDFLQTTFSSLHQVYHLQVIMKGPRTAKSTALLNEARQAMLLMISERHTRNEMLEAALGPNDMMRAWAADAEASLFNFLILLDEAVLVRQPLVVQKVLESLNTFLQECEQPVRGLGLSHIVRILVGLFGVFQSAREEGAEHWWDRAFRALHKIDMSREGRSNWCRGILMQYQDTRQMSLLCNQFRGIAVQ